jgi:hypothetical protein
MMKRVLARAAIAAAALTLGAGPALATDGPAFNILFYNDAAHTTQVGFAHAICTPDPAARMQWGTSTQYQEVVFIGQCIDGQLYYDVG